MSEPSPAEARDAVQHLMSRLHTVEEADLNANKVLADFIDANESIYEVME